MSIFEKQYINRLEQGLDANAGNICEGYSIDDENALILDDAFNVEKKGKGEGYVLSFFIADTSTYYDTTQFEPKLQHPDSDVNTRPNIGVGGMPAHLRTGSFKNFVSQFLSLNQGKERPAIRVRVHFDKTGRVQEEKIAIDRVTFKNVGAFTKRDVNAIAKQAERNPENADKDVELWRELADKVDQHAQKHRLERYRGSTPADFIMERFSNVANFAISCFVRDNEIPVIYQNQSAMIPTLQDDIDTRQQAYGFISTQYGEENKETADDKNPARKIISASLHGRMNEEEYGTYSTGNILKGYRTFARFSSPMQCIMETFNIRNLTAFLDNPEKPNFPATKNDLKAIARISSLRKRVDKKLKSEGKQHNRRFEDQFNTNTGFNLLTGPDYDYNHLSQQIQNGGYVPATYQLKQAIFDIPEIPASVSTQEADMIRQKTSALAQEALKIAINEGLSEQVLRMAVERDGKFDALYFVHESKDGRNRVKPILVDNGEKLTCREKTMIDDENFEPQYAVKRSCNYLLSDYVSNKLIDPKSKMAAWPKGKKKKQSQLQKEMNESSKPKTLEQRYPKVPGTPSKREKKLMREAARETLRVGV